MLMEYISLWGFLLAVFTAGIAVGILVEKINRLDRKSDLIEKLQSKNDRP